MDSAEQLPKPVLDALASRAQTDPAFLSLMARIQAGTANAATATAHKMSQLKQPQLEVLLQVPQITEADLFSFHQAHFGGAAISIFAADFLDPSKAQQQGESPPQGDESTYYEEEYEEDDGLGYYPDGVKRTLTDEQIAMFRHSEVQTLLRSQEKAQARRKTSSKSSMPVPIDLDDAMSEEGELAHEVSREGVAAKKNKNKKKNNKKKKRGSGNGNRQYSPDPERRKRTWDVVETGLDGLDYGETEQAQTNTSPARQRRRITYEDG